LPAPERDAMNSRFEILPFARGEEEAARLPGPAHLTVTCSPKHGLDHTVEVAARLRALGHLVTVHFAARMVRGRDHLDELLETSMPTARERWGSPATRRATR
jgi:methylenetetrahydrofolate reductase (NADPH)